MIIVAFTAHCPYGSLTDYRVLISTAQRISYLAFINSADCFFLSSYTESKMLNIIGLKQKFWVHPCLLKCSNKVHTPVISRGTEETKPTN